MTYRKTTQQIFDEIDERLELLLPGDEAYNYRYQQEKRKITDDFWSLKEDILRKEKRLGDLEFSMNLRLQSLGRILDELIIQGSKVLDSGEIHRRKGFFVYALFQNEKETPVYIGKTTSPAARLGVHSSGSPYKKTWDYFRIVEIESSKAMDILEAHLINHFKPEYNKVQPLIKDCDGLPIQLFDFDFKDWGNRS
jgi:hypothetical protein